MSPSVINEPAAVEGRIRTEYQDCELLQCVYDPNHRPSYEEATHPLKYVPDLALRVGTWLIAYREPDELYRIGTGDRVHPYEIKGFILSESVAVEPVLVEGGDE